MNSVLGIDPAQAGGGALIAGSVVFLAALYGRDPGGALAAATASTEAAAVLSVPALGLCAGGYAYVDAPYAGVGLFTFGTCFGVVGIGLALGALLTAPPSVSLLAAGLTLFGFAVTALVAGLVRVVGAIGVSLPGVPSK